MIDANDRSKQRDIVYMNMAHDIAELSKDENTQIGCVIVAKDGTPVSWGYNGTLAGINDALIPHSREVKEISYIKIEGDSDPKHYNITTNKYPWMRHAERNAIKYANSEKLKGATLYVNAYPCEACALEIADSGITRVVIRTSNRIDVNSSTKNDHSLAEAIMAQKDMQLVVDGVEVNLTVI